MAGPQKGALRDMKRDGCIKFCDILSVSRREEIQVVRDADDGGLTLGEFRRQVAVLAEALNTVPAGRLALCFQSSGWMAVGLLAAIYARRQVVIPGHLRESVLREQAATFDAVLTDLELDVPRPVLQVPRLIEQNLDSPALPDWTEESTLTFYTSGSSGQPKAVAKSIAQLERENRIHAEDWGRRMEGCRIIGTTSHQHLYGLQFRILLPLTLGCPFNATMLEYHEQLCELKREPEEGIVLITSPAFLKRLDDGLQQILCRFILSAGGVLSAAVAQNARKIFGCWPFEIYGSTEAGAIAWRDSIEQTELWTPFPGVAFTSDVDGRLSIQSQFLDGVGMLVTDDQIEREGGRFRLKGRMDQILKIEEKRISLVEVEQRLLSIRCIEDVAVVPLTVASRLILGAVIVVSAEGKKLMQELGWGGFILYIRRELTPYLEPVAIPRSFRVVDCISLNTQGKRDRTKLQSLFQ